MREFRVTIRARNNLLVQRREELGLSQSEFCRAVGVNISTYCTYECMREDPIGSRGWKPIARKIADYHGVAPAELWPDSVLAVEQVTATRQVTAQQMAALAVATMGDPPLLPEDVDRALDSRREVASLEESLGDLHERDRRIVEMRFGLGDHDEHTLAEVAAHLGVSRERARQIEQRAMWRLRRAKPLRAARVGQ